MQQVRVFVQARRVTAAMLDIHHLRKQQAKAACGVTNPLRSTEVREWVDCKDCLVYRPAAGEVEPDQVVVTGDKP
jgi:hypothetical protein